MEWALRDLLWLAAWNSDVGPDEADPEIAAAHADLLEQVIELVRRQYELTVLHRAKKSPVRTRDGLLVAVADGISSILKTNLSSRNATSAAPGEIVAKIKVWLDTWQRFARAPEVPLAVIERGTMAEGGIVAMQRWVKQARGPVEATVQLLVALEIVGRTRFFDLRAAVRAEDNDVHDLLRERYGPGIKPRELREFAMRLVGFSDAAIAAAQAEQLEPIDVDLYFGMWLR